MLSQLKWILKSHEWGSYVIQFYPLRLLNLFFCSSYVHLVIIQIVWKSANFLPWKIYVVCRVLARFFWKANLCHSGNLLLQQLDHIIDMIEEFVINDESMSPTPHVSKCTIWITRWFNRVATP
jgi:hypothetical protein